MYKEKMEYLKKNNNFEKVIRTEVLFTPLLIIVPVIVGIFLIYNWYVKGFLANNSIYDGELLIGIIILFGNFIFDIPFLKSLKALSKGKN